ncbi:ImmA/IrrE family metallo-endopeptidase [Corynebacterium sp.]|uniref:ImmA/IrrE family metallo-endopeptidase n=1 Tax=Corynebacterium sp. TaxID=1720 RepID=UPI0028B1E3D1|nr:ImmA/IrrE family metallo-endopeptidase [Corynebacterium sp.]
MSTVEDRLADLLVEQGVRLLETDMLHPRFNAVFHNASRAIIVRSDLDPVTRVCAIAHELGHAVNNDSCSSPRAERLADEWAAQSIIDHSIVEDVAQDCGGAPSAIAAELGITPHLLSVWMQLYEAGRINTYDCAIY